MCSASHKQYDCQIAVVGSGAGGAVAAAALAEADKKVLLLEEGKAYATEDHGSVLDGFVRMYRDAGATLLLGRPPMTLPLGKTLGGTTAINSSTCFRPPPEKVARWKGLTYEELLPFVEEVEARIHSHVVSEDLLGGNWTVMKRGCDALGIPIEPLFHNLKDCQKSGRCQFGCPVGAKQSMERTYVPDAAAQGCEVLTQHRVERMKLDGNRVLSLEGRSPHGSFRVKAERFVLSMGALPSPAFLLKHRFGRRLPRLGKGLQVHPATRVVALFDEVIDGHLGLPQGAGIDHWAYRGVRMEGIFLHPGFLYPMMPGCGYDLKERIAQYRNLSAFGVFVEDSTRGRVLAGRFGYPFFALYNLCSKDAQNLRFGIARLTEIYLAAGAKTVFTGFAPCPTVDSNEEVERFESLPLKPIHFELGAFHPVGTCPMGEDPRESVVDWRLKVHGLENLYVMDASVIPESLGVNPQITIMSLALRGARSLALSH